MVRGGISEERRRWLGDTPLALVMDPSTGRLLKFDEQEPGRCAGGDGCVGVCGAGMLGMCSGHLSCIVCLDWILCWLR